MRSFAIFIYEWKHFIRSPFKVVALILFIAAGIYALHNGANLYKQQVAEIDKIQEDSNEDRQMYLAYYEKGEKGPSGRPWVDVTTPFWAIWYTPVYHFKSPSPAIVYSIGQAEQYGFYKRVTFQSSPYDADLAEEIANPERLQSGTLDFSFVMLYLAPLLLLILLYNIKGAEVDAGFLHLVHVQTHSGTAWLLARVAFYGLLLMIVVLGLMIYGAFLTSVFKATSSIFWQIFALTFSYLFLWELVFLGILNKGKSSLGNTLKMVGVWLLFAFIIPAIVHQWVSIKHPANLMTDLIDAQRDKRNELYEQPDSVMQAQLNALFPEIIDSPVAQDDARRGQARSYSSSALANELLKESIAIIESSNEAKNELIQSSYWFSPVTFFQNKINSLSQTHFQNYQHYRTEIQSLIDKQVRVMVLDIWNDAKVDKQKYLEYNQILVDLQ